MAEFRWIIFSSFLMLLFSFPVAFIHVYHGALLKTKKT